MHELHQNYFQVSETAAIFVLTRWIFAIKSQNLNAVLNTIAAE